MLANLLVAFAATTAWAVRPVPAGDRSSRGPVVSPALGSHGVGPVWNLRLMVGDPRGVEV